MNRQRITRMSALAIYASVVALLGLRSAGAETMGSALENILVSKQGSEAIVRILPRCGMRYLIHSPPKGGSALRVRMSMSSECDSLLKEVVSETYDASGRHLADIDNVVFDSVNRRTANITITMSEPHEFEVHQGSNGWVEIRIETGWEASELAGTVPDPLPRLPVEDPDSVGVGIDGTLRDSSNRGPSRLTTWTPEPERFVVQLGVFANVDTALEALGDEPEHGSFYTNELIVNGKTWQGLQLGFFDSEAAAEIAREIYAARFPDAWVRAIGEFDSQPVVADDSDSDAVIPAVAAIEGRTAGAEELEHGMLGAREAILSGDYDEAISLYTGVLEVPDHSHRPRAREFLGVANERSGRHAAAISEYRAYLREFPESDGVSRVSERLSGLTSARSRPRERVTARPTDSSAPDWQWFGGVSQYYRRDVSQRIENGDGILGASALYNYADFTVRRRGERFDLLGRASGNYVYDLNNTRRSDEDNVAWVSDAFLQVQDQELEVDVTLGRQRHYGSGVLGRFDGAAVDYQWRPDISFGLVSGIPIDSSRYIANRERFFYAFNAKVTNIRNKLDLELFTHQQTVGGISDRESVGSEIHFRDNRWNVVALLDFDLSYKLLNTALLSGNWQVSETMTLNGRIEKGTSPFITTRNALAGQSATRVDELLATFSEGAIRTLARDRTADATYVSIGISAPVGQKLRFSTDVAMHEIGATVASGGVAAIPATGDQVFINATLVGTSLLRSGDLTRVVLRQDTTRTTEASSIQLDARYPLTDTLRLNPAMRFTRRTILSDGSEQRIAEPSIRLLYRWRRHILFELEAGGRWSNRVLPPGIVDPFLPDGSEEIYGSYLNLGYRAEF